MITTSENATQKSITFPTRSVHHISFLWALCYEFVRSTTHRFVAQNGAGLPFPEISHLSPSSARRSWVRPSESGYRYLATRSGSSRCWIVLGAMPTS
jgi:hypothetical protein